MQLRTSFDLSGLQEFYYVPFFIFPVVVFSLCKIVKPFFDAHPAAVVGIVTPDGVRGFISRLAVTFRDVISFGVVCLRQDLPGCWLFE